MAAQVARDPFLRGVDKAQADAIAHQTGSCSHGEGGAVKNRVECTGAGTQLIESLFAPDQMVYLFLGGFLTLFRLSLFKRFLLFFNWFLNWRLILLLDWLHLGWLVLFWGNRDLLLLNILLC